jgi:hypothetical protein
MRTEIGDKRWAKKYPHVGTGPVAAEPCVSPEYFELERERVFRKVWLNVGRVEDVPKPSNSQFEFLGRVERELDVEALEHEGEEMRPAGKTQIARERPQIIKEGLTAH